jgi:hypothetical protein
LDQWFPGSKFILTIRDSDSWIRSVKKHFRGRRIAAQQWIYGVSGVTGNESVYIKRFQQHNGDVVNYFRDRPGDLLIMDITKGDGWEKLCPFLGKDQPPFDFPLANIAAERSQNWVRRGRRFLSRKIDPDYDPSTKAGVPSGFLRDILHYYFSSLDDLWSRIEQLLDEQYYECEAGYKTSLHEVLLYQATETHNRYQWLTGGNEILDPLALSIKYPTREALHRFWKETCFFLRWHAARLEDNDFYARVPGRQEAVREVYLHLMDAGARHSGEIRRRLQDFSISLEEQSVMSFFYDEDKHHYSLL